MIKYNIVDAKKILLSFSSEVNTESEVFNLPLNVKIIPNVIRALNNIISECLDEVGRTTLVPLIRLAHRILDALIENKQMLDDIPEDLIKREHTRNTLFGSDNVCEIGSVVNYVKDNVGKIQKILEALSLHQLLAELRITDWSKAEDLEVFFDLFYDTYKRFGANCEINVNNITTEWHALSHYCKNMDDEKDSALIKELVKHANFKIDQWMDKYLGLEFHISTMYNTSTKLLKFLKSEERTKAHDTLRQWAQLQRPDLRNSSRSASPEPRSKRARPDFSDPFRDELDDYIAVDPLYTIR